MFLTIYGSPKKPIGITDVDTTTVSSFKIFLFSFFHQERMERAKSLSILKQFIRHFVSIVVKWRVYPNSCSCFEDKGYVGLHLKYMDPVDNDLQILNDDIYNITQWIEQGVIQNISSLKSFELLLFYHEKAILESYSIELLCDNSKSNNDSNGGSIARKREKIRNQIRDVLEETLHLLKRTNGEYKGNVSVNILTKNQCVQNDLAVDEKIIEKTRHHPMDTILSDRTENDLTMKEKTHRYGDLNSKRDLPLCQRSVDSSSSSTSTISHMNLELNATHEIQSTRLGHAQFPCHDVVIFHKILQVNVTRKDHCAEIQRMFHVDLRCISLTVLESDHIDRKVGVDLNAKSIGRQEKQLSKSPPHVLSPNTPHPSSMKGENTPTRMLNKRKRTPISSPKRSMQFGDTPVLRRRHHYEETNEVSIISPKIDGGQFGLQDRRNPRSGSSSDAPTMIVNYSTSGSKATNISPNISPYSFRKKNIGKSSSPLPATEFQFSQDEHDIME